MRITSAQQAHKVRLFEVMVAGECFAQAAFSHHDEAGAVRETS
jgi:hypothetical protein